MFFSPYKPRYRICQLTDDIRVKYLSSYFPFHWLVRYFVDNVPFQKEEKTRLCHLGLGCCSQPFVCVSINVTCHLVTCLLPKERCLLLLTEKASSSYHLFLIPSQITENTEKRKNFFCFLF